MGVARETEEAGAWAPLPAILSTASTHPESSSPFCCLLPSASQLGPILRISRSPPRMDL